MKIVIGIAASTIEDEWSFLTSYWNCIEGSNHEIFLVIVSDLLDSTEKARREASCRRLHAQFLSSQESPARQIFEYAKSKESELCFLFPHSVNFFCPGLLTRVLYFFERN